MQFIGVILVFTATYPQILKAKNRLKILLSRLNLQEHYNTILKIWNIECVGVMAMNCILFMKKIKTYSMNGETPQEE